MGVLGRIEPAVWPEMLKAASPRLSTTIACTTIMSPTDATSRASGGELRSGRKTRTKISNPERGRVHERDQQRGNSRDAAAEDGHSIRQADDGEHEVTRLAEIDVRVRDEHRDRALSEVDDPRAPVLEHEAEAEDRVDRPGAEAEEEEEEVGRHPLRSGSDRCGDQPAAAPHSSSIGT